MAYMSLSLKLTCPDCFTRLYMQSHPMVRSQKPKKRKSPSTKKQPLKYDDDKIIDSFVVEYLLLSDVV